MELDESLKSKIRFHLGYNSGAQMPVGDRARLEEAMSLVPDTYWYEQVVYHLTRCDNAWKVSAYFPDDMDHSKSLGQSPCGSRNDVVRVHYGVNLRVHDQSVWAMTIGK